MKNIFTVITILIFSIGFSQSDEALLDYDYFLSKGGSFLYSQKDSAYFYLKKSYEIAEKNDYLEGKLTSLAYIINTNTYHFDLSLLNKNLNSFERIISLDRRVDTLFHGVAYKRRLLLEKGQYFYKLKNYNESIEWFVLLIKNLESIPEEKIKIEELYELNSAYSFLASIYENIEKLELSKEYHEKTLSLAETLPNFDLSRQVSNTKMRFARVYEKQTNYIKANELLNESLVYHIGEKNNPRFKNSLISIYQRLSKNFLLQDSISKAISTLKKSEEFYTENDAFERSADKLYGDIYTSDKQFDKAETFYQSYLSKTKTYRQDEKHQDIADAFSRLGSLYLAKENPEKALEFYQNSLIQIAPSFNDTDIKSNPKPKKVLSKLGLVKILKEKLEGLQLLYKRSNQLEDLKMALTTSYAIIEALDLLKPEFESKVDKQFLISEMYPAFHKMVEVAYDLYNSTKESSYIADAFYFTEKSKSVLLLEAARSTQASSYGGVPEEIIDREQQFRANIIHLEKKFFNQKSNMVVFDSLFQLKNRYYNFISDIERNYPKYYDLKYNSEVVSLEEATSKIIKNKALISYFATNTDFYVITLENQNKNFYKIHLGNDGREKITSFYSLLSKLNIKELPDIYGIGNSIYEQILKKPLETIESKELIIIPDDILNYLPFEALSTSKSAGDYLIREYQISYTNSVTLLREQQNKLKLEQNKLLAYAPSFENSNENVSQNRLNFGPLLYNTDEVTQITEFFDGKAITGKEASLASFSKNSHAYNMLHFATHAATNDEYPDYSYLAFAKDDSSENGLLYVKDLYGYSINADLVALSGCQTGLGKLQKGEGMLSLARGFSYAGAKSLVTTLWKVNDQTTSELIQEFYKNLDASLPKDKALREAKLTYLETVDDELLTHPYYWSGFMISGDTAALQTDASYLWWLLLLGIPILFVTIRKVRSLL
ncbi:CHAT domain-containing tetratricopeptide repeat protein [uncultured Aquimarina sp.]|uniref:CHAT domain-containing protein n=1 Tax=uncultured Aquimarina sp. TaxID=575652 RepID=UPI002601B233|nr:CHAT domain-containing tetratricopeptide repeat protein [uncultured Aquimarina sp.]